MSDKQFDIKIEVYSFIFLLHQCVHFLQHNLREFLFFTYFCFSNICLEVRFRVNRKYVEIKPGFSVVSRIRVQITFMFFYDNRFCCQKLHLCLGESGLKLLTCMLATIIFAGKSYTCIKIYKGKLQNPVCPFLCQLFTASASKL